MLRFGSAAAGWAEKSPGQFIIETGSSKPAAIAATCIAPVAPEAFIVPMLWTSAASLAISA